MSEQPYAFVAVHTVALSEYSHRIIKISVVRIRNQKEVNRYTSLVNPQLRIPTEVTQYSGIDNETIRFEPVFCELADELLHQFEGAILVSHSDLAYLVLRSEFKRIGYRFSCHKINIADSIRRIGLHISSHVSDVVGYYGIERRTSRTTDGLVTASITLFHTLNVEDVALQKSAVLDVLNSDSSRQNELGIHTLEQRPGVYYFKDVHDHIIYIGKAVRLKERVKSHFANKASREKALCFETHKIDFVYTGSNTIAELLESDEIATHHPKFNIDQKKHTAPFIIVTSLNKKGYSKLSIVRKDYVDSVNEVFYNRKSVVEKLKELCKKYYLCPKLAGFHSIRGKCNHDEFTACPAACIGEEEPAAYNSRVKEALQMLNTDVRNFAIRLKGKKNGEMGFVLVRDGVYLGYGYVGVSDQIATPEDFENFIIYKTHSYHTTRIIDSFIRKPRNKSQIIYL